MYCIEDHSLRVDNMSVVMEVEFYRVGEKSYGRDVKVFMEFDIYNGCLLAKNMRLLGSVLKVN